MDQDWAAFPLHLLDLIFGKLKSSTDCLQFSVVCSTWHSVLKANQIRCYQVPLLLYPSEEENKWTIYNIIDNKFSELNTSLSFKKRLCGSSQGWLAGVNDNYTISIYRPSYIAEEKSIESATKIDLPCLFPPPDINEEDWSPEDLELLEEYGYDYHVKKTLITADPLLDPNNCIIMVIYGEYYEIAFIRPTKDAMWTKLASGGYDDVVYYKNQFYAITGNGKLVSFDLTDPSTVKCIASEILLDIPSTLKRYIVESCEGLLQIVRYITYSDDVEDRRTKNFKVFRVDFDWGKWDEIQSLGGSSLFLGDSSSISVLASDFSGCQPNSIYFTHDDLIGLTFKEYTDLGRYDIESGSFKFRFTIDVTTLSRGVKRPPIWIVPLVNKN